MTYTDGNLDIHINFIDRSYNMKYNYKIIVLYIFYIF